MTKHSIITLLFSGLSLIGSVSTFASSIPAEVLSAYQQGLSGDQEKNQAAFNALSKINEASPNPVVLALLGSSETTQARYTNKPWQKMKFAEKGIAKLSKAIKQAKDLPYLQQARVNVTAGCTFSQLPKMMNRAEHGRYLLNQVMEQKSQFGSLEPTLQASAYRCASIAAKKLDDEKGAEQFMALAQSVAGQSPAGLKE
ncbi:hypothetical protein J8L98_16795 [Pseudoalteromonas sp. MMG013]|uniref:hypothetical protein n=1 Tax=unclassified Pseudoalteromonas TaxID=194690 RepID=UPI001B37A706|nr:MULTISPECIES: hypothetical protein [unclassified Pseudoalteromonas]MBQ4849979.1 hypothetical protein [Pseudoalteromonas sp. MMG012]MBQ4863343.1 hypothetical protein [Pseudoalteromonas sp. MMG013]